MLAESAYELLLEILQSELSHFSLFFVSLSLAWGLSSRWLSCDNCSTSLLSYSILAYLSRMASCFSFTTSSRRLICSSLSLAEDYLV
jgi:hypothetical protein